MRCYGLDYRKRVRVNVADAVEQRRSTRAFRRDKVSESVVRSLLERARFTPSGGNLQPWHVYVLTGERRQSLTNDILAKLDRKERETSEYEIYPSNLWEPLRSRRRVAGAERYRALGLTRQTGDQAILERMNYEFFGAPVGLFFCLDRRVGPPQWSDVGMFMQTLMLLAVEEGLASCPQEVWSNWPGTLARHLLLPVNLMVFAGMSLGYAEPDSPMNAYRTEREPLDAFATLLGFSSPL